MTRSRFVLFIDRRVDHRSVAESLAGEDVRIETSWVAFTAALDRADAAAVITRQLERARANDVIALRAGRPTLPLVLVCAPSPSTMREVNRLPELEAVLAIDELADGLAIAMRNAAGRFVLLRAAAWIEVQEHLSPELRATLARACRRRRPARTVESLAHDVMGASKMTLWTHWKKSGASGTPHAFIQWLLAVHGAAASASSVPQASQLLQVDPRTLRDAMRMFGAGSTTAASNSGSMRLFERLMALIRQKKEGPGG